MQATIDIGDISGFQMADQLRETTSERQELAARSIGQQLLPAFRIESANLTRLDPPGKALRIELQLQLADLQSSNDDQWLTLLPLPTSQLRESFGDRDERRLPLRLEQDITYRSRVRFDPGEDRMVTDLPPPYLQSFGPLDYQLTFTRDGNAVVIERQMQLRPATITPAVYADWIRLLAEIDRVERRKLVLKSR